MSICCRGFWNLGAFGGTGWLEGVSFVLRGSGASFLVCCFEGRLFSTVVYEMIFLHLTFVIVGWFLVSITLGVWEEVSYEEDSMWSLGLS